MGPSQDSKAVSACVSLFAIGSMFLILTNMQFIFYLKSTHYVFTRECRRQLYPAYVHWLGSPWAIYALRSANAVCFSVPVYLMIELDRSPQYFLFFILSETLMMLSGLAMCELVIYSSGPIRDAYTGVPAAAFFQFLFSGLFLKPQSFPVWMKGWMPAFSFIRWNMQGQFLNTYTHQAVPGGLFTIFPSGYSFYSAFLNLFGWNGRTRWFCAKVLVINVLVYRVIGYLYTLYSVRVERKHMLVPPNDVQNLYVQK